MPPPPQKIIKWKGRRVEREILFFSRWRGREGAFGPWMRHGTDGRWESITLIRFMDDQVGEMVRSRKGWSNSHDQGWLRFLETYAGVEKSRVFESKYHVLMSTFRVLSTPAILWHWIRVPQFLKRLDFPLKPTKREGQTRQHVCQE